MNMSEASATLLPNGLVDLLPPQAELESATIESFMKIFSKFGYARVKPPLVEFEESLLGPGPGKALARQTFRLMDPVSQRMMGLRADVTAQIARIATSRLSTEQRPLRVSYAADILRVNGTQLRPERQFCQVGCELIGEDSIEADVEVSLMALKALCDVGIAGLSIDLTVPTILPHLYAETQTDEVTQATLNDLIEKRDIDALGMQTGAAAEWIVRLLECEGEAEKASEKLSALSLPGRALIDVQKLLAVASNLCAAIDVYDLPDVQVTIAPLERRGFEYQTGTSFTLFAMGASGELGRGGQYELNLSGEIATGFTFYMDSLLRVLPQMAPQAVKEASSKDGWRTIKSMQDQGVNVARRD